MARELEMTPGAKILPTPLLRIWVNQSQFNLIDSHGFRALKLATLTKDLERKVAQKYHLPFRVLPLSVDQPYHHQHQLPPMLALKDNTVK